MTALPRGGAVFLWEPPLFHPRCAGSFEG